MPFHHDPSHSDETLDRLLTDAKLKYKPEFDVLGGYEGSLFELEKGTLVRNSF